MISFLLCSVVLVWYAPELQRTYGKVIPYFNLWYFLPSSIHADISLYVILAI